MVKVHDFDFTLASRSAVILYSFRDLRDAIASHKRVQFPGDPSVHQAQRFIDNDRLWRDTADMVMRYESMIQDRESVIGNLARALGVEASPWADIAEAVAALKHDPSRVVHPYDHDAQNLLHPGHITNGRHGSWEGCLDPCLVAALESRYHDWFVKNRYLLSKREPR